MLVISDLEAGLSEAKENLDQLCEQNDARLRSDTIGLLQRMRKMLERYINEAEYEDAVRAGPWC